MGWGFWWCFVLLRGGGAGGGKTLVLGFFVALLLGVFYLMSCGFWGIFSSFMTNWVELISVCVFMYHRLCELKGCTVQFTPSQHPPQQNAFHPPWLFPSKCEMMVSICSAADRMFCDFCMSNCTGWSNEIPSFVLEDNQWDCICIAYKMNHVSEITLPTSHFLS